MKSPTWGGSPHREYRVSKYKVIVVVVVVVVVVVAAVVAVVAVAVGCPAKNGHF